jgi:hypothetical protein
MNYASKDATGCDLQVTSYLVQGASKKNKDKNMEPWNGGKRTFFLGHCALVLISDY